MSVPTPRREAQADRLGRVAQRHPEHSVTAVSRLRPETRNGVSQGTDGRKEKGRKEKEGRKRKGERDKERKPPNDRSSRCINFRMIMIGKYRIKPLTRWGRVTGRIRDAALLGIPERKIAYLESCIFSFKLCFQRQPVRWWVANGMVIGVARTADCSSRCPDPRPARGPAPAASSAASAGDPERMFVALPETRACARTRKERREKGCQKKKDSERKKEKKRL
jgi:hypothetical protein